MHPFEEPLAIYVAPDDGPVTGHVEAMIFHVEAMIFHVKAMIERRSYVEKSKIIRTLTKEQLVRLLVMNRVVEITMERKMKLKLR